MSSQARLQSEIERGSSEAVTIETVLTRGVETLMPETGLESILSDHSVRLYLGIDPTSPYLHIGHMVPLRKLQQFQALGHQVILLFGTFTGMIGDPSDKTAARVRLTPEQVEVNVATYKSQAGKILDLSSRAVNPVNVVYNHEWLGQLTFMDVIELASNFTINQFIARETYKKRLEENTPLYVHEVLYPIMQGYDSVALDVELEIGGTDQIPNMLAGKTLINRMNHHEKWVMGMKLIEDPTGAKMGKTTGNVVNLVEAPEVIYEALMTWPDTAIALGLELLTSMPMALVEETSKSISLPDVNPMYLKEAFAFRVVSELNGEPDAQLARGIFDQVYRGRQLPPEDRVKSVVIDQPSTELTEVLVVSGLAKDVAEASSLLAQGAVYVDGKQARKNVTTSGEYLIQLGKRTIKNLRRIVIS